MVTASDFQRLALDLPGASARQHFDRIAFRVERIFATLAADGLTANLGFTPDEQAWKCGLAPDIFTAIDNAWGRQGWTTLSLSATSEDDVAAALELAHAHAVGKRRR